jgi:hypothetical protein
MPDSKQPADIERPPFPRLRWADGDWVGTAILPAWAGFQSRGGAYGGRDSTEASDGGVRVSVASPHPNNREPPSAAQAAAFGVLVARQAEVRDAMLEALLAKYAQWRAEWEDAMDPEEFEERMPPVAAPAGFRSLIGLSDVHVHTAAKDGVAYIGFELGCTWDYEHGLGFMTHGTRVVEVGGADTSVLEWIAERDARRRGGAGGAGGE